MNNPFSNGRISREARNTTSNQTNSENETETSQTPPLESESRSTAVRQALQQEEETTRSGGVPPRRDVYTTRRLGDKYTTIR